MQDEHQVIQKYCKKHTEDKTLCNCLKIYGLFLNAA